MEIRVEEDGQRDSERADKTFEGDGSKVDGEEEARTGQRLLVSSWPQTACGVPNSAPTRFVHQKAATRAKGRQSFEEAPRRAIMHCDFDCFFVSAGLIDRPELRGNPLPSVMVGAVLSRFRQLEGRRWLRGVRARSQAPVTRLGSLESKTE